jgi:hypothetical protein
LHAIEYRGRIELVPVRPARAARGSLPGIDTDVPRDPDIEDFRRDVEDWR